MAAIDVLEKNLEIANQLPQVIDRSVELSVFKTELLFSTMQGIAIKNLTPETLREAQSGRINSYTKSKIINEVSEALRDNSTPIPETPFSEWSVLEINAIESIKDNQRTISHQTVAFICTSFEAYCKDRFEEIAGKIAPQNVMNFAAIYQLFAVHTKALKTVSDEATLETTLRAIPIDIDSLKKCFAYRHVIVHRAAMLDIKGVQELGLANSDVGTALPRFSLNDIQTYAQAVHDTAHWIDTNTK